jgi:hypothetical protein
MSSGRDPLLLDDIALYFLFRPAFRARLNVDCRPDFSPWQVVVGGSLFRSALFGRGLCGGGGFHWAPSRHVRCLRTADGGVGVKRSLHSRAWTSQSRGKAGHSLTQMPVDCILFTLLSSCLAQRFDRPDLHFEITRIVCDLWSEPCTPPTWRPQDHRQRRTPRRGLCTEPGGLLTEKPQMVMRQMGQRGHRASGLKR